MQSAFVFKTDDAGNFNLQSVAEHLKPVSPERSYQFVRMDGEYVKHVDLLQIDFAASSFERKSGTPDDPPADEVEHVVGDTVRRLRYTIGAPWFREFRLRDVFWITRYLQDDESELSEQPGFMRARGHAPFRFIFTGLDDHSWKLVRGLSFGFSPHLWEVLHLDARFLLPEVGPAVVLAFSAIEAASEAFVRHFATSPAHVENLLRKHRVGDRLDTLAMQFVGKSLKSSTSEWDAFDRLRRTRNAFAHTGRPALDGAVVDEPLAFTLVDKSEAVLRWIENELPPNFQTHKDPYIPRWEYKEPLTIGP
jgi:hypothetical protein